MPLFRPFSCLSRLPQYFSNISQLPVLSHSNPVSIWLSLESLQTEHLLMSCPSLNSLVTRLFHGSLLPSGSSLLHYSFIYWAKDLMRLFSELCLDTSSDRDLTMHSSHIQTTLIIKMSETARTGHQDSFVLGFSRETTNRVDWPVCLSIYPSIYPFIHPSTYSSIIYLSLSGDLL